MINLGGKIGVYPAIVECHCQTPVEDGLVVIINTKLCDSLAQICESGMKVKESNNDGKTADNRLWWRFGLLC
jgi:hypothetical protein